MACGRRPLDQDAVLDRRIRRAIAGTGELCAALSGLYLYVVVGEVRAAVATSRTILRTLRHQNICGRTLTLEVLIDLRHIKLALQMGQQKVGIFELLRAFDYGLYDGANLLRFLHQLH